MQLKTLFKPLRSVSARLVFLLLGVMLITHLIIFLVYTAHEKKVIHTVNRDLMTQRVITLVHTLQKTPNNNQQKTVQALDVPNIIVSLTEKPRWNLQFESNMTLWGIHQVIRKEKPPVRFSLMLGKNKWVNLEARIISPSWGMQILLLFLEVVTASAILFSIWSMNRFAIPMRNFMKAAQRFGVDVHAQPLEEERYGPTIVRNTAHAMNTMQRRLQAMIKNRTQMLAAISHDLRTPITRLKLRAQFIDDEHLQQKTLQDLSEMEAMINETLAFAKNDQYQENKKRIDIAALICSLCDDTADMGKPVTYKGPTAKVRCLGRKLALKRAFTNIINNAIHYGTSANVIFTEQTHDVVIEIEDEGPGIPEAEHEKVFAPFYRAEKSRSRKTGGTGLGLAVTKDIIDAHRGRITLENKKEKGLRVTVRLPKSSYH